MLRNLVLRLKAVWWILTLPNGTRELIRWVGKGIEDARKVNHDMVHGQANINGVKDAGFFLVCTHPKTAQKARALLVRSLPLCTTDLGKGYQTG
jgi:hypothetical protein